MDTHHSHSHAPIPIEEWKKQAVYLDAAGEEEARHLRRWDDGAWSRFPDAGEYQPTRLTAEVSNGSCNAIWLKLEPGEAFDPHRHANAFHIMLVYEGSADIFWQEENGKILAHTMVPGDRPYVVNPSLPHALANVSGKRAVILVLNAPADNLHDHDYATPVTE